MLRFQIGHALLNRFPIKHLWDALSLLQVVLKGDVLYGQPLPLRVRWNCVNFYFSALGIRRLLAGSVRSGNRWFHLVIAVALDLSRGGQGNFQYADYNYIPDGGNIVKRFDWRVPTGAFEDMHANSDVAMFRDTLLYFTTHIPFYRVRSWQLKRMRVVLITRSIFAILESRYFKLRDSRKFNSDGNWDESAVDWEKEVEDVISFQNSWGDVLNWHPNILHVRYEDLKRDPVGTFAKIFAFWQLDVDERFIDQALELTTKARMSQKIPHDQTNIRVSTRGTKERGVLSPERIRWIEQQLDERLVHDLGHGRTYQPEDMIAFS